MKKDSTRLLAIAGAIAVPLAALLFVDYLASISTKPATPEVAPLVQAPAPAPAPQRSIEIKANDALASFPQAAAPHYAPGTYRCKSKGHTAYTDKPERDCEASSPVVPVSVTPATAGFAPDKPYQQQLAELEHRQAEEAAQRIASKPRKDAASGQHETVCRMLWEQIQHIDSLLRQAHSAAQGDYWTSRRRELSDRRHTEHC